MYWSMLSECLSKRISIAVDKLCGPSVEVTAFPGFIALDGVKPGTLSHVMMMLNWTESTTVPTHFTLEALATIPVCAVPSC